ncbi:MAG: DUF2867 domain-containing protein [Lachnoclostridium sp.]|nr:DUF2867 domain-containing protein [Lachnoclostridium sp.]
MKKTNKDMGAVTKRAAIPDGSGILDGFGDVNFWDSYCVAARTDQSPAEIMRKIMTMPRWVAALFRLRNAIVGVFGLKTGSADAAFPVISQTENEVITGLPDKHLNFRASLVKDTTAGTISLTTVVHFNNIWGRIYFLPVKPFHKIILRTLLHRYSRITHAR